MLASFEARFARTSSDERNSLTGDDAVSQWRRPLVSRPGLLSLESITPGVPGFKSGVATSRLNLKILDVWVPAFCGTDKVEFIVDRDSGFALRAPA